MKIDKIFHSRDLAFRYIGDRWAKDLHKNLKLPGEFIDLLSNDFAKDLKTGKRMDFLMLVRLDNEKELTINLEHQSSKLNDGKLSSLWNYRNYSICNKRDYVLTVVITPFPKDSQLTRYEATKSDILEVVIICVDYEDIQKRLNSLKDYIKNNNHIENHIVLEFSIIAIFVEKNEYEILKELSALFNDAKTKISNEIAQDTEAVLTGMIEQKLINNKCQVEELIGMYTDDEKGSMRGIRFIFEEEFAEQEERHKKEEERFKKEISQKDDVISHLSDEISQKDDVISQKNSEIANLKLLLSTNGIIF